MRHFFTYLAASFMQNRMEYLSSDQGGNMRSDFLTLKKQLQIFIRALDNELLDHLPANSQDILFADIGESSDAETRRTECKKSHTAKSPHTKQ
jgi:hypothetical protein